MYSTVYKTNDCTTCRPAVNVQETENDYQVMMAVPGYSKEEIKIKVDGNELTISSDKKSAKSENYLRKEFALGKFERTFELPKGVVGDNISAGYNNGILTVTIPKKEKVEIKIHDVAIAN